MGLLLLLGPCLVLCFCYLLLHQGLKCCLFRPLPLRPLPFTRGVPLQFLLCRSGGSGIGNCCWLLWHLVPHHGVPLRDDGVVIRQLLWRSLVQRPLSLVLFRDHVHHRLLFALPEVVPIAEAPVPLVGCQEQGALLIEVHNLSMAVHIHSDLQGALQGLILSLYPHPRLVVGVEAIQLGWAHGSTQPLPHHHHPPAPPGVIA
mmetsp:Transcript_65798/g.147682  ORF Transcript_65798/g.147682 Transcript_65798/m.147682 type:complete len:202 (-) Transcript_65798:9-614(-)